VSAYKVGQVGNFWTHPRTRGHKGPERERETEREREKVEK